MFVVNITPWVWWLLQQTCRGSCTLRWLDCHLRRDNNIIFFIITSMKDRVSVGLSPTWVLSGLLCICTGTKGGIFGEKRKKIAMFTSLNVRIFQNRTPKVVFLAYFFLVFSFFHLKILPDHSKTRKRLEFAVEWQTEWHF